MTNTNSRPEFDRQQAAELVLRGDIPALIARLPKLDYHSRANIFLVASDMSNHGFMLDDLKDALRRLEYK